MRNKFLVFISTLLIFLPNCTGIKTIRQYSFQHNKNIINPELMKIVDLQNGVVSDELKREFLRIDSIDFYWKNIYVVFNNPKEFYQIGFAEESSDTKYNFCRLTIDYVYKYNYKTKKWDFNKYETMTSEDIERVYTRFEKVILSKLPFKYKIYETNTFFRNEDQYN